MARRSRVISAQKVNTATPSAYQGCQSPQRTLYSAVQPGGSLFGLQESNPVRTDVAYGGSPRNYGRPNDPMVGERIGGVNVFGGGLALYDSTGTLVAIGVRGDSSCADHNIAWRTRHTLNLDYVPGGVSGNPAREDNMVYDVTPQAGQMPGVSASGWGHPVCSAAATTIAGGSRQRSSQPSRRARSSPTTVPGHVGHEPRHEDTKMMQPRRTRRSRRLRVLNRERASWPSWLVDLVFFASFVA